MAERLIGSGYTQKVDSLRKHLEIAVDITNHSSAEVTITSLAFYILARDLGAEATGYVVRGMEDLRIQERADYIWQNGENLLRRFGLKFR
ncbi:MAG: hypothetical protein AAB639_00685 [Patescibacteria group bacterium]